MWKDALLHQHGKAPEKLLGMLGRVERVEDGVRKLKMGGGREKPDGGWSEKRWR